MAKDNTFYFTHDYNARNDSKIKKLLSRHGYLGYGLFWAIIEDLYNNANALPTDYESIAFDLRTDSETIKSIINDFELFEIDESVFGSLSVQRRLIDRDSKSIKARESANKRWNKYERNANALQSQCEPNAIKESKGKESKGKEINNESVQNEILPHTKVIKIDSGDKLKKFQDRLKPFVETYGKEMIRAFYNYWTEKSEGAKKMRYEFEKSFDISRRLTTWNNREHKFKNNHGTNKFERAAETTNRVIGKLTGQDRLD